MIQLVQQDNILYKESEAISEMARVQVEQPILNKKNHRWNVILGAILFGVIPVSMILLTLYLFNGGPLAVSRPHIPIIIVMLVVMWLTTTVYTEYSREVLAPYEWYSANAEYYRITKGYTPLSHDLIYEGDNEYTLHVEMEDDRHQVYDDFVLYPKLKGITKTDVQHITVDLLNGKVYLPYKNKA